MEQYLLMLLAYLRSHPLKQFKAYFTCSWYYNAVFYKKGAMAPQRVMNFILGAPKMT